jgi:ferredoxin-NADP reductase
MARCSPPCLLVSPWPATRCPRPLTPARTGVKQEPHCTASSYLHRNLQPGAVLDVAGPRGDFVLDDRTGPVLLISAGIGVIPVLSIHAPG